MNTEIARRSLGDSKCALSIPAIEARRPVQHVVNAEVKTFEVDPMAKGVDVARADRPYLKGQTLACCFREAPLGIRLEPESRELP